MVDTKKLARMFKSMSKVVRYNLLAAALLVCAILLSMALGQREILIRVASILILQVFIALVSLLFFLVQSLAKRLEKKVTTKRKDELLRKINDWANKGRGQYVPNDEFLEIVAKSLSEDGLIAMTEMRNSYGVIYYTCEMTTNGIEYLTQTK